MKQQEWPEYVHQFHHEHPGITEEALHHASHPEMGSPYDWLAAGLPQNLGRVLDCAAGTMPMQVHLAGRFSSYTGVDLSLDELHTAAALGRGPGINASVLSMPLTAGTVDTAVMSMALMLLPLDEALTEIARVLAVDGQFAAMVPAVWPISPRDIPATASLTAVLLGPGSMPRHLSPSRLREALTEAGFAEVQIERARFSFCLTKLSDADLAVRSLYTPGRSKVQRGLAAAVLNRLPGWCELPVPLLRVTARLSRRSMPTHD